LSLTQSKVLNLQTRPEATLLLGADEGPDRNLTPLAAALCPTVGTNYHGNRGSSHGVAYRRGSTVVTMGPARDYANGDTSVYPGSGLSRVEVKPLLPACFILSRQ
jgi:hypothetical protein